MTGTDNARCGTPLSWSVGAGLDPRALRGLPRAGTSTCRDSMQAGER